jgi:hypothetical protein
VVLEKDGEDRLTDRVRNEEVLLIVKDQRNILYEISKWKANGVGPMWRRKGGVQGAIEGKIGGGG